MAITISRLDPGEALRYMGCPPEKAGEELWGLVEECAGQVLSAAVPRWAWRVLEVTPEEGGVRLEGGLLLPGADLKGHLSSCRRAAVFCATLGAGVDTLIRRAEQLDMSRALALDCCASAAVEELCDRVELELQGKFPGCFFPYRFSPGYGDLPLEVQGELLELLDAPRRVGLCANQSALLTPRKSVTAILGISEEKLEPSHRSCLGCPAREGCQYRKAGGYCGL